MKFDQRVWFLFAAGVLIFGAILWRLERDDVDPPSMSVDAPQQVTMRPAPLFEAFNQENQIVRLASFAGRHEIWLVFFNEPLDRDPLFQAVMNVVDAAEVRGIKIIGITPALPQVNRRLLKSNDAPAIPILTDPEPIYKLHREWGLVDDDTGEVRSALFAVDRLGNVAWEDGHPRPVPNVDAFLTNDSGENFE